MTTHSGFCVVLAFSAVHKKERGEFLKPVECVYDFSFTTVGFAFSQNLSVIQFARCDSNLIRQLSLLNGGVG